MSLAVLGAVYPVIFISELPDKTMFAALVLATRGRAFAVWSGAAAAFAVHVSIAVTVGAALLTWLPQRAAEALVAALFLGGAVWIVRGHVTESAPASAAAVPAGESAPASAAAVPAGESAPASAGAVPAGESAPASPRRVLLSTFAVVFLAEWGDLTQILTVGLAARFHAPVAVGVAAGLALWSAAALAVLAGQRLHRLPAVYVRRLAGLALLALAVFSAVAAITGG